MIEKKAPSIEDFVRSLDKEAEQERGVAEARDSFLDHAPAGEVIVRRAREYDDIPKHYVRSSYWLKLAKRLHKAKGKGLRLLTLPGRNALEIGLYHKHNLLEEEILEDGSRGVAVVGFETSPEVFGLLQTTKPRLWRVFDGDLVDALAQSSAPKYREFLTCFPFDIINLDLTVNLVAPSEGPYGPVPAALRECFRLQGAQPNDWALMLTFRAGLEDTDQRAIKIWRDEYQKNLDDHPAVREACFNAYAATTAAELYDIDAEEALGQYAAKWITDQAHVHDWRVLNSDHVYYVREHAGGKYTIRKLIFRLTRQRLPAYAMPGKHLPAVPWHVEDLATVIKECVSDDVDKAVREMEAANSGYLNHLKAEIEELKVLADSIDLSEPPPVDQVSSQVLGG